MEFSWANILFTTSMSLLCPPVPYCSFFTWLNVWSALGNHFSYEAFLDTLFLHPSKRGDYFLLHFFTNNFLASRAFINNSFENPEFYINISFLYNLVSENNDPSLLEAIFKEYEIYTLYLWDSRVFETNIYFQYIFLLFLLKGFVCGLLQNKLEKRNSSHLIFILLTAVFPY